MFRGRGARYEKVERREIGGSIAARRKPFGGVRRNAGEARRYFCGGNGARIRDRRIPRRERGAPERKDGGVEKAVYRFDYSAGAADVSGDGRDVLVPAAACRSELYSAICSCGRHDGGEFQIFQERVFRVGKKSAEYGYAGIARLRRFVFVFDVSGDKNGRDGRRTRGTFVF